MLSIILVTVALPAVFAREHDARLGLKKTVLALVVFLAAYVAYAAFFHTRYHVPPPWPWAH